MSERARNDEQVEALASYAHEAWSGWIEYMISMCEELEGSSVPGSGMPPALVIPSSLVARWTRQLNTTYAELPESEKESDRAEARKMLHVLAEGPYDGPAANS